MAFKDSMSKKKLNARIARWVVNLAEFDYEVEHRRGEKFPHVYALSRSSVMIVSAPIVAKVRAAQNKDDKAKAITPAIERGDESKGYTVCIGVLYEGDGESRRTYVPEYDPIRGHFGVKKTKGGLTPINLYSDGN